MLKLNDFMGYVRNSGKVNSDEKVVIVSQILGAVYEGTLQDLKLNGPLCKQQQFEAGGYLNRALRSGRWDKSAGKDAGHSDDYSLTITID